VLLLEVKSLQSHSTGIAFGDTLIRFVCLHLESRMQIHSIKAISMQF